MRLVTKVIFTVLMSTVICLLSLLMVYYFRYNSVLLYQLDHSGELFKENIITILLPSLVISGIVNVIVGLFVGLYASRKYAVPIFKLEQWAMLLQKGKMSARLTFREREEMKELSTHCNMLADDLRNRFREIKKHTEVLKKHEDIKTDVLAIETVLANLELESSTIDVHTNFIAAPAMEPPDGSRPV